MQIIFLLTTLETQYLTCRVSLSLNPERFNILSIAGHRVHVAELISAKLELWVTLSLIAGRRLKITVFNAAQQSGSSLSSGNERSRDVTGEPT